MAFHPAFDTDLEERCYAMALQSGIYETGGDPAMWEELEQDTSLAQWREDLRSELLYEFLDIDGPRIAELMDDALAHLSFPFDR